MAASSIKEQVTAQMKEAMKAKDKDRLGAIRMILAEFKRIEVDERVELKDDDTRALAILDKMLKQRRDALSQFESADREDLAAKERFEIEVIQTFMPAQLTDEEIDSEIDQALSQTGAQSVKDMGKVMGVLKPKMQGRADMAVVSTKIKDRLSALSS